MENALLVFDVCCCNAEPTRSGSVLAWESAQPAYAEGFGVAGAHLSRRSECEGRTPNIQRPIQSVDSAVRCSAFDFRCSMFAAVMGICRIVTVTIIATHIDDPTPAVLCHCAAIAPRPTGTA